MELIQVRNHVHHNQKTIVEDIPFEMNEEPVVSAGKPFIEANTISTTLQEMRMDHIIPVFVRENEPMISPAEFIELTQTVVNSAFKGETVLQPTMRVSHAVKGRIPEAKNKSKNELLPHEETLYYERMAFIIEVPSIYTNVAGNRLNLTIGGVKAYNLDNQLSRNYEQQFKVFIGYQNKVCTNMCVSTDGYLSNLKVRTFDQLRAGIRMLIQDFNAVNFSDQLRQLAQYELSERQFATLVGRCRMYKNMPEHMRLTIPELQFGDSQINSVCREYYADENFSCKPDGGINLWRLYNLFTGSNKSTYIDQFGERAVNAYQLSEDLMRGLQGGNKSWYLN